MNEALQYSIEINAPRQKVWETMLSDATYRDWTSTFSPGGSYFEGSWEQGSKMLFLGPDEDGSVGGMVSKVAEARPYEFISLEHQGLVEDGKEDLESEYAQEFAGAHENYTFEETDGVTKVTVDLEGLGEDDEMKGMFEDAWPKALQRLKELAEA